MSRFIRIKGLIAFVVIVAIIAAVGYFLLDGMVKSVIESEGTKALGARVDLASAKVSFSPMGLTLEGLQVTNPDSPMENAVEIARMALQVDTGGLLLKKLIVEEMSVEGIQFSTPRKVSGAVKSEAPKQAPVEPEEPSMPVMKTPSAKDILSQEELTSLKIIDEIKADIDAKEQAWKQRIAELPDKGTLDTFKSRFEAIKKTKISSPADIKRVTDEINSLKRDLDAEKQKVESAVKEISPEINAIKAEIDRAKRSPGEDIARLKNKYSLSGDGLQNFSRILFSDKINAYVDKSMYWYDKAEPYIAQYQQKKKEAKPKHIRGKGITVSFPEHNPRPSFLIKKTAASLIIPAGNIAGSIRDITHQPDVIDRPVTFDFSGTALKGIESITSTGSLDHRTGKGIDQNLTVIKGSEVAKVALSKKSDFPLSMQSALMDTIITTTLQDGTLNSRIDIAFNNVIFDTGSDEGKSTVARALSEALRGVAAFTIRADASGTVKDRKVQLKISSDLDKVLQRSMGDLVKKQAAELEQKLRAEIEAKTEGKLAEAQAKLKQLEAFKSNIDAQKGQIDQQIKDATNFKPSAGVEKPSGSDAKKLLKKLF